MTEYAKGGRDARELDRRGGYFSRHMVAMTAEDLNAKGDIAAELAWRDARIAELEQKLAALRDAARPVCAWWRSCTVTFVNPRGQQCLNLLCLEFGK